MVQLHLGHFAIQASCCVEIPHDGRLQHPNRSLLRIGHLHPYRPARTPPIRAWNKFVRHSQSYPGNRGAPPSYLHVRPGIAFVPSAGWRCTLHHRLRVLVWDYGRCAQLLRIQILLACRSSALHRPLTTCCTSCAPTTVTITIPHSLATRARSRGSPHSWRTAAARERGHAMLER